MGGRFLEHLTGHDTRAFQSRTIVQGERHGVRVQVLTGPFQVGRARGSAQVRTHPDPTQGSVGAQAMIYGPATERAPGKSFTREPASASNPRHNTRLHAQRAEEPGH